MVKKLLSAAVIAATAFISSPAIAAGSHPSCDLMLEDMAITLKDGLSLHNTNFPYVNWVLNELAPFFDSKRNNILIKIAVDNANVKMVGGGVTGYFWKSDFIDPEDSPAQIRGSYDTMYNTKSLKV
jgi:hypothetical protein